MYYVLCTYYVSNIQMVKNAQHFFLEWGKNVRLTYREKNGRRRFFLGHIGGVDCHESCLFLQKNEIPAGNKAKNGQTKIYARPIFGWIKSGQPKLNPPEKSVRRRFSFGRFLSFFQQESPNLAKTNNFRVNLRRRYGLKKIYADHFFGWIKS